MDNKSKFLKGLIIGAILSGAASSWWNSEQGKDARESIQESFEDFNDFLRPRVRRFRKVSYKKFQKILKNAALEYADLKNMSKDKIEELIQKGQHFLESQD